MENKVRLIDANKANTQDIECGFGCSTDLWCVDEWFNSLPTVDAVEVVHSYWEKSAEGYRICHHCKADVAIFSGHKNYCPNCGAKMDGRI